MFVIYLRLNKLTQGIWKQINIYLKQAKKQTCKICE